MYKLLKRYNPDGSVNPISTAVVKDEYITIPFDPANTDYQTFRKEVLAGAELQDDTGNVMTQEQANAFVGGLV